MKSLEAELAAKAQADRNTTEQGKLEVNSPVPDGFAPLFAQAVAQATGCSPGEVMVVGVHPLPSGSIAEVTFTAPRSIIREVEEQAADPDSTLTNGPLRPLLVAKQAGNIHGDQGSLAPQASLDIDTAMPYGDLEPFGREDTAQELTESSVKESDGMVDQLEKAELAEEKRSVFRALTRLRGLAIASFDAMARSQTGNIDSYSQSHKWRDSHPLHHLAEEEGDVSAWAFPSRRGA